MIAINNMIDDKSISSKIDDDNKRENIFGQTLTSGQPVKTRKIRYLEEKNKKKSIFTLGLSFFVLMIYSVFFFYGNVVAYLHAPTDIANLQGEIKNYKDVILPSLEKTKELHKAAYDKEFEEVISSLLTVFPNDVDKLGIVRLFESFSVEVAASFPPFEFTSINLAPSQKKNGYIVTPISTSIHSSLAGFDRFLSLVDHSGYIYSVDGDKKVFVDKKIRLMSISNISVKYRGVDEKTGKDQGVDFSVKLNIYSRSEPDTKTK